MLFFILGVCCRRGRSIDHSSVLSSEDLRRRLEGSIRTWNSSSPHSILIPHTDDQLDTVP